MATVSDYSMLRGLKCAAIARVHVVMTTCVDGKKRPEVICRGVGRFLPFLTWFPFGLANLPLPVLVWSALAYCTLPTYCYMYTHLVVMFSCKSANTNVPPVVLLAIECSCPASQMEYVG